MIRVEFEPHEVYAGNEKTLADLIIDGAVSRLLVDFRREEAVQDLRQRIRAIRDEVLAESLRETILVAIEQALQPTDSFGSPKGEPKKLYELIRDEAIALLTKPSRDSYGSPKQQTLVQELIATAVRSEVEREMKAALDAGRAEIREALKAKGAEMLEKALIEMANGKIR